MGFFAHLGGVQGFQGFNRYAYVNNNPYRYTDPDGKAACAGICVGVGIGITWGYRAYRAYRVAKTLQAASQVLNESNEPSDGETEGKSSEGSPEIDPGEVAGKSPEEIEAIAGEKGLEAKGPNPKSGEGAYVDPVTGKQRILVHPDAECGPHCHVNDPEGNRLDDKGNKVPPESPEAHLPLG